MSTELKRAVLSLFVGVILLGLAVHTASAQARADRPDSTNGPTQVSMTIGVIDVSEIKAASQSKVVDVFFMAVWHDPRLAHPGPGLMTKDLDEVWNPRLQIVGQRRVSLLMPRTVEVSPDGQVVYRQRLWGEISQPLKLQDFPFDRQDLTFRLTSVGYTSEEIEFASYEKFATGVGSRLSLPDWKVVSSRVDIAPYQPLSQIRAIASYGFRIEVQRRSIQIVSKMIIPLFFVVMMSWAVFWLDPDMAGPQMSVAATAMLTLIAYRFMLAGKLPQVAYLTRLDVFILGATTLVFLTLVEAVFTAYLARSGQLVLARRIDRRARWIMPLIFAGLFVAAFVI